MAIAGDGDYWRLFYNSSGTSFNTKQHYEPSSGLYAASRLLDFNLDGHVDVFLAADGAKERYLQGKASSWEYFTFGYESALGKHSRNLDVTDVDGDGKIDVIVGNAYEAPTDDSHRYLVQNTGGPAAMDMFKHRWDSSGFVDGKGKVEGPTGAGPAFVADFNNDNHWDVLLPRNAGVADRAAMILLNDGKGK